MSPFEKGADTFGGSVDPFIRNHDPDQRWHKSQLSHRAKGLLAEFSRPCDKDTCKVYLKASSEYGHCCKSCQSDLGHTMNCWRNQHVKAALEQNDMLIYDETNGTGLSWFNGVPVLKRPSKGQGNGEYSSWNIQSWDRHTSHEDNWSRYDWDTSQGEHGKQVYGDARKKMGSQKAP